MTENLNNLRTYSVYCHENKINGKRYIGLTSQEVTRRWGGGTHYKGTPFYNAILKYGWDNFNHDVLFSSLTKEEACEKEQELILEFKTYDNKFGYNATFGGEAGQHTEETKDKLRQKAMERYKNPEIREKISEGLKEFYKNNPEKKNDISKRNTGRPVSKETREKLSLCAKGRKQSDEWIEKRFKWAKEEPERHKEVYEKLSRRQFKIVICIESGIEYESIKEASKQTGICESSIINCCKGRSKAAGGFTWKYKDEKNKYYKLKSYSRNDIKKKVICVETGVVYDSIAEAGLKNNAEPSNISIALKSESRTCRGFHWKYYKEDE